MDRNGRTRLVRIPVLARNPSFQGEEVDLPQSLEESFGRFLSGRTEGTSMNVHRAEVLHISILAPRPDVLAFLSDVRRWKSWAPWARSVERLSASEWTVHTVAGPLKLRFVEPNSLGVLDHMVTLPSGATVLNSMRVLPNGEGSELAMVLFQSPATSTEEFERDIQAVREDLARIKNTVEALPKDGAR